MDVIKPYMESPLGIVAGFGLVFGAQVSSSNVNRWGHRGTGSRPIGAYPRSRASGTSQGRTRVKD